jgi:methyl-accepting chemotaxis protein
VRPGQRHLAVSCGAGQGGGGRLAERTRLMSVRGRSKMFSSIRRPSVSRAIIATNLLILLFACIAAAMLMMSLGTLKVHGPVYNRIKTSADLTADILPPPLNLIETYLTVLQAKDTDNADQRRELVVRLDGLEKDFNDRRIYWAARQLPAEVKNVLEQKIVRSAQAIFEAVRSHFVPALTDKRGDGLQNAAGVIASLYVKHREEVDQLVKLANKSVQDSEVSATESETIYLRMTWAILAVTLAIAIGSAASLIAMIARPVRRMTDAMRSLAAKDFAVEIPARGRSDEIGQMAEAVQVFKDSMVETERLRREQEQDHRRAADEKQAALKGMADRIETQTGTGLREVGAHAAAMAATAEEMNASAVRTKNSVQNASTASAQVSVNAQTVASAAEELSASIREVSAQMTRSHEVVGRAVAAGVETRATIDTLNEQVASIGAVADMIGEIAARTNLLALNATIEAARAGDAGKGFAVVASEVKALATQTARSTREIAQHIAQVSAATRASVGAVEQIERTIGEVSTIAGCIAAAVEEQGVTTAEIARNVAETASAASEMTIRVAEVATEAEQTRNRAAEVHANATGLSTTVEVIAPFADPYGSHFYR